MEVRSSTPPRKRKIEDLYELTEYGIHYISQNLEECSFISYGRNISFPTGSDQRRPSQGVGAASSSGMTFEKLIVGCKYRILSTIPEPFVSLKHTIDDQEWKYKYDSGNYLFLIKHRPPPAYFYNELFNIAPAVFRKHKSETMRDEIAGGILILPRGAVEEGYIIPSMTAGLKGKSKKKKKSKFKKRRSKKHTKRKKKRKSKRKSKKSKMR